jgi:hypothetical protein
LGFVKFWLTPRVDDHHCDYITKLKRKKKKKTGKEKKKNYSQNYLLCYPQPKVKKLEKLTF